MPPVFLMSLGSLTWCLLLGTCQQCWRSLFSGVEFCSCLNRGCVRDHPRSREEGKSLCFEQTPHESHCFCEQNVSVWPYALLPMAGNQGIQHIHAEMCLFPVHFIAAFLCAPAVSTQFSVVRAPPVATRDTFLGSAAFGKSGSYCDTFWALQRLGRLFSA